MSGLLCHDKLSLLQKDPTVLGAQASSPARVPPNQQPLTEWVALDAGRRGRLRSQDRGAFLQEPLKHIGHCLSKTPAVPVRESSVIAVSDPVLR